MHTTSRVVLFLSSLLVACVGPNHIPDNQPLGAVPMGEYAPRAVAFTRVLIAPEPIAHHWTDSQGNEWDAQLNVHCCTDAAHEELARTCLRTHWSQAVERCSAQLKTTGTAPKTLADSNTHLLQELNNVLFPCEMKEPVGKVTGIEWQSVTMRSRGAQPKK